MKQQKKIVYLFVFNGFADWEASYATVGIGKSAGYQLKTIAIDTQPVVSMGGLTIVPDQDFIPAADLPDINAHNTAMLILPGGLAWHEHTNEAVQPMVAHCLLHGIPVAAICGATVFLADAGVLDRVAHTSNDLSYLEYFSKGYQGKTLYQKTPSVRTELIITASGTAAIEFAADIFDRLNISDEQQVCEWFKYFDQRLVYG
jgi:putative intracellular protease/amidase